MAMVGSGAAEHVSQWCGWRRVKPTRFPIGEMNGDARERKGIGPLACTAQPL
jgi:hypothetical protein